MLPRTMLGKKNVLKTTTDRTFRLIMIKFILKNIFLTY